MRDLSRGSSYRWMILFLAILMTMVGTFIYLLPSPLLTTIIDETGWNIGDVGQLISMVTLFLGIFVIAGTTIIDRLGVVKTMFIGFGIMFAGCIFPLFAGVNYGLELTGRLLFGIGYGMTNNIFSGLMIAAWFDNPKEASFAHGLRTALCYVGMAIPYYVIIPVYNSTGSWQMTFALFGFILLATAIVFAFFFRMPKDGVWADKKKGERTAKLGFKNSGFAQAACRKATWLLWFGMICKTFAFNTFNTYLPAYLQNARMLDVATASQWAGLLNIFGAIGGIVMGIVVARTGRRRLLGWPVLTLMFAAILGVLFLPTSWFTLVCIAAVGFGNSCYAILYILLPNDWKDITPSLCNGVVAIVVGLSYIPSFFVPRLLAQLLPTFDYTWTIFILSSLLIPAIIVFIFKHKETGPVEQMKKERAARKLAA